MKDCPSCGASVPDSAAQCPSCRHTFEDDLEKGRTLLGIPAEEVPSSPEETASADSEEEDGDDPTTTQFGLPAAESDSGPEIDTSAQGPDEGAADWSDLDEVVDEDSEASILDAPGSSPSVEPEPSSEDGEEGDDGGERVAGLEIPESSTGADDEASAEEEIKRTQMGMPRFDPDRVAGDASTDREGVGAGDDDTAPGTPGEADESPDPEVEPTAEFNLDSLKEQVEEEASSSAEDRDEQEAEEESVDPASTIHGKAAKALSPASSSSSSDAEGLEESSPSFEEGSEGEVPAGERGLFGKNTYMQRGSSERSSSPDEEGEAREGRGRETYRGQPVPPERPESNAEAESEEVAPEVSSEAERAPESTGKTGGVEEESESDGLSLPAPDEVEGTSEESSLTGFEGPTGFEVADDSGELSLEGEAADDNWGRRGAEDSEGASGDSTREAPGRSDDSGTEEARTDVEEIDGTDAEEEDIEPALGLAPSSPAEELFATIEEESSDAFEETELEEVEAETADEEFAFFDDEDDQQTERSDERAPKGVEEDERERSISQDEETVQVERPEDLAKPGYDLSGEPGVPGETDQPISGESEESGSPPEVDFDAPAEPAEPTTETRQRPRTGAPQIGGVGQTVTGVLAGLVFGAFVGIEVMSAGLLGHFLTLALGLAGALGAVTCLLLPFIPISAAAKSGLYLGVGVLVSALSVSTLLLVVQGLAVGPLVAFCAGILAVAAGLIPTIVTVRAGE